MRLIFFSKYSEFDLHYRNVIKKGKKVLVFEIISLVFGLENSPYFDANTCHHVITANVITNSPKISDLTKRKFFQLNISQINGTIG